MPGIVAHPIEGKDVIAAPKVARSTSTLQQGSP